VWIAAFAGNKAYDGYFCRADEATGMPLVDPYPSSPHGAFCAAATPCLRRRRAIGPTVRRCAHWVLHHESGATIRCAGRKRTGPRNPRV